MTKLTSKFYQPISAVGNTYHLILQDVKYINVNKIQGSGSCRQHCVLQLWCCAGPGECVWALGGRIVACLWQVDVSLVSGWTGCKKWQDVQGIFGKEVPKLFVAALRKTPAFVLVLFHKVIKILNRSRWGMKVKCLHIFQRLCSSN